MKPLSYYTALADKGNAEAAYEAAKLMYYEKYNEVLFQSMLRKAANLGDINAKRWLGFIGLAGKLVAPGSTVTHVTYLDDRRHAYAWFERAAAEGDVLSVFAVCKCLQQGIGVAKNTAKADALLQAIQDDLDDDMLPLMFFLEAYKKTSHRKQPTARSATHTDLIKQLLAG